MFLVGRMARTRLCLRKPYTAAGHGQVKPVVPPLCAPSAALPVPAVSKLISRHHECDDGTHS